MPDNFAPIQMSANDLRGAQTCVFLLTDHTPMDLAILVVCAHLGSEWIYEGVDELTGRHAWRQRNVDARIKIAGRTLLFSTVPELANIVDRLIEGVHRDLVLDAKAAAVKAKAHRELNNVGEAARHAIRHTPRPSDHGFTD